MFTILAPSFSVINQKNFLAFGEIVCLSEDTCIDLIVS